MSDIFDCVAFPKCGCIGKCLSPRDDEKECFEDRLARQDATPAQGGTPRTDAAWGPDARDWRGDQRFEVSRQLERELAEANAALAKVGSDYAALSANGEPFGYWDVFNEVLYGTKTMADMAAEGGNAIIPLYKRNQP